MAKAPATQQQGRNRGSNRGGRSGQGDGSYQREKDPRLSDPQFIADRTKQVLELMDNSRKGLEQMLPVTTSYEKLRIIVQAAMRKNPDVLLCYTPSIISACMSAAYDGLLPDGREGALVPHNNSLPGGGWRKEARWNPMVAGLRKQILAGKIVSDVITTIIYANELTTRVMDPELGIERPRFLERRGTAMEIRHDPLPESTRGAPVGAYAVAFFFDGRRPTFEVMWAADIKHVQTKAKGGAVWNSYELEMWRKTVLRRFRKSLPGGNDVTDMEARELFPEYAGDVDRALEDKRPAKPQREDYARLEDNSGTGYGMAMDFGGNSDMDAEMARFEGVRNDEALRHDPGTGEIGQDRRGAKAAAVAAGDAQVSDVSVEPLDEDNRGNARENTGKSVSAKDNDRGAVAEELDPKEVLTPNAGVNDPRTRAGWDYWIAEIERECETCETREDLDNLKRGEKHRLEMAPAGYDDRAAAAFAAAIADFEGN